MDNYNLLTKKYKEILKLIAFGKSTKEIMEILKIKQSTLKTYITQIFEILNLSESKAGNSTTRIKAVNIYWKNNPEELNEFKVEE